MIGVGGRALTGVVRPAAVRVQRLHHAQEVSREPAQRRRRHETVQQLSSESHPLPAAAHARTPPAHCAAGGA